MTAKTCIMLSLWEKMGPQFLRFFIVGVGATLLHWIVFVGLNRCFSLSPEDTAALNATYTTGYIVSFVGNYIASLRWTFRTHGSVGKGLGFAFSHAVNYGMHLLLLNFFLWLGVGEGIVFLLQSCVPALVEALPILAKPDTLLPLPLFMIVVPVNFLLVRFFLTRGDEKKLD